MEVNMLEMQGGPFDELLSFAEAAAIWKVDESTLRKAVKDGRLKPGHDCRKFGKQWVVTVEAMARVFNRSACPHDYTPWSKYLVHLRRSESEK